MNGIGRTQDSKEIKIKELNGWVRKLLITLLGLIIFGTVVGLIYWRKSYIAQKRNDELQAQLLRAIFVMDSTFKADYATKEDLRSVAEQVHPDVQIVLPEEREPEAVPDTAYWREQIQMPKEEKWKK